MAYGRRASHRQVGVVCLPCVSPFHRATVPHNLFLGDRWIVAAHARPERVRPVQAQAGLDVPARAPRLEGAASAVRLAGPRASLLGPSSSSPRGRVRAIVCWPLSLHLQPGFLAPAPPPPSESGSPNRS